MTGRTAVFFAAENGHDAAAHILVAYGADPNQQDVVKLCNNRRVGGGDVGYRMS